MLRAGFSEAGKTWGKGAENTKKRYLQPTTACLAVRLHATVLGCCCESCWGSSILPLGTVDAVVLEHPAESFHLQAPRPSTGPHKLRECLPLIIFLRNRLKYALTGDEVKKICMQRFIKIDGKVRTDITYPAGFMDVISIEKTGEHFRLVYDTKGRFAVHRITVEEAKYKLCKVRKIFVGTKGIPHLVTHDARTIRYPDPLIKVNDTVQIDLETGKITDFIKFDTGNLCMVTGGANLGRIGVITNRERHPGSFDVVHVKATNGQLERGGGSVLAEGNKPWISLPRGKGIRLTIAEERDKRLAAKQSSG
ncbi:PREDICTED: 40S ribosomal protein S4 [Fulmarus glacialis]|uniref:40S ribosomal protein S4 n=1 Tax=Fulmarus glacialis TaxID=30455 RepID=UPI00051B0766|nr:PREDICTED: 40S ribosomal protein S4 [Fulmarus glacialis]